MIKVAKRCPYCAHKVDKDTGKCINQNCIAFNQVVVKAETQEAASK